MCTAKTAIRRRRQSVTASRKAGKRPDKITVARRVGKGKGEGK